MSDESLDPDKIEKKAYKRELVGHLFSSAAEEAIELYWTAGNAWKTQQELAKAANCFLRGIQLAKTGPEVREYAIDAGHMYMKLKDYQHAVQCLTTGIDIAISTGKGQTVASTTRTLASAYRHLGQVSQARNALEQASALYFSDRKPREGTACLMEIGELLARRATTAATFWDAALAYDQAAMVMNAHGFPLPADLCVKEVFCAILADNHTTTGLHSLNLFDNDRPMLDRIAFAAKSNNDALFTDLLWEWDQRCRMDDTTLQLSLKIKRVFELNELL